MAKKYLTSIDLNQNEMQNGVLGVLGAAPSAPKPGQIYYNSTVNASAVWNGTAWVYADASKLSGTIPIAALAVDPTARANHTGTQLALTINNLAATVQGYSLSTFGAPTANIPTAGFTFTGLPAPTAAGQAAEYSWTIGQIQSAAAGISSKPAVNAVATTNIAALTGTTTVVDGITITAGLRVLLTAQTTASQNGVYVAAAGAWARPTTEGATGEIDNGALWFVEQGTNLGATQFRLATLGPFTLGTTALSIVQFGAATAYTTGNGLTLTGSTFAVGTAAGSGILVAAGTVSVDTAVVMRKFPFVIGDGTATSFTVNHGLNTQDIGVACRTISNQAGIEVDWAATSTTTATITLTSVIAANAVRGIIYG